ncbi:transketolase family protein [Faecalicatena contorta]|uniref:Transketolase n=1 Tax=Faecalicatena contorta TaxID=39482 RepID=A0A316ADR3_9FIRM|nr:transketolase family protein [Faecalicatena contorta]PWJ47917.1 transketolase [Faecalicatena contorta]SUQ15680.1 transketolase [Faecalicatena contorta]
MNYKIDNSHAAEKLAMRDAYAETMTELVKENPRIVYLEADLMNSIGMVNFAKEFPDNSINCGIQEANMIGTAAGMSAVGMIPFTHTFGCFATRRALDQIFLSGAYARTNIRMLGSDPGVTAAFNGATHMPFEDIGLLRGIPNITIIEPTDSTMLRDMVKQTAKMEGIFYIRLSRKNAVKVFEDGSTFDIGKAVSIKEGTDVTLIASGICVDEAMKAAEILQQQNINAAVLNVFTIKPIDREAIAAAAKKTGAIVTVENHNIHNGLGSAVAEVLAETTPVPMARVGVQDKFGEVGSVDYLKERFGLTAENIVKNALEVIGRK